MLILLGALGLHLRLKLLASSVRMIASYVVKTINQWSWNCENCQHNASSWALHREFQNTSPFLDTREVKKKKQLVSTQSSIKSWINKQRHRGLRAELWWIINVLLFQISYWNFSYQSLKIRIECRVDCATALSSNPYEHTGSVKDTMLRTECSLLEQPATLLPIPRLWISGWYWRT